MLKTIIFSLFIGVLATLFVAQYDPWVRKVCAARVCTYLEQGTPCAATCALKSISFFSPELVCDNVTVKSTQGAEWEWRARRVSVSFSWWHFIKHGRIDVQLYIDGCSGESSIVDDKLAVLPHIYHFFTPTPLPIPVTAKLIEFHDSSFLVTDMEKGVRAHYFFSSTSKEIDAFFKTIVQVTSGSCVVQDRQIISHVAGTMQVSFPAVLANGADKNGMSELSVDNNCIPGRAVDQASMSGLSEGNNYTPGGSVDSDCTSEQPVDNNCMAGRLEFRVHLPHLDKPVCFVAGRWEKGSGRFSVRHVEQALMIDPCIVSIDDQGVHVDVVARCPLSYVWRIVTGDERVDLVQGNSSCRMRGSVGAQGELKGQLAVEDFTYNKRRICSAFTVTLHKIDHILNGQIKAHTRDAEIGGAWHVRGDTGEGSLSLHNSRRGVIPGLSHWYLDVGDFASAIHRKSDSSWAGSYQCKVRSSVHDSSFVSQGALNTQGELFTVQGFVNDSTYEGNGSLSQAPYVHNFQYRGAAGDSLVSIKGMQEQVSAQDAVPARVGNVLGSTQSGAQGVGSGVQSSTPVGVGGNPQGNAQHGARGMAWSGVVAYPLIRSLLNRATGFELQGKGSVTCDLFYDAGQIFMDIGLKDGIVRLPYTYNFIDSLGMRLGWDFDTRLLRVQNFKCGLHTGIVRCVQGQLQFDAHGSLLCMHVPFVLDHCLCNVKKNVFAMVSGYCLFGKQLGAEVLLNGRVIIDRAQIKDSFLSLDMSRAWSGETGFMIKSLYSATRLGIVVETKGPIRIDTPLLQTQAEAHIAVGGTVASPTLEGDIVLDAGSIVFPYKPLFITKGKIHFEADSTFNPTIELRARNKIKKHVVSLYAHGLLHDYQVILDSNPPLTEEQIISLLLVGSSEDSLNMMMPALIMHNLKMALLGSGSLSFLDNYFKRRAIPFSINLVPSFTDQTGRGGLRGGIEVMVNDRWRALIQKNFSLSEDTRFELEYLFSDDVGVRVVRDERRDMGGEVEMRWKF